MCRGISQLMGLLPSRQSWRRGERSDGSNLNLKKSASNSRSEADSVPTLHHDLCQFPTLCRMCVLQAKCAAIMPAGDLTIGNGIDTVSDSPLIGAGGGFCGAVAARFAPSRRPDGRRFRFARNAYD